MPTPSWPELIARHFNISELEDLCHQLEVEFEELGGTGRKGKARELVAHLDRHGRMAELAERCRKVRPKTQWPEVSPDGQPIHRFPLYHIPYPQNPNFTGRVQLLAQLEAHLQAGKTTAITQAITGLGGVGKTQLALEYCYNHLTDYDLIWWFRADDEPTLSSDLAALANALGIAAVAELEVLRAQVQHWLTTTQQRWLLVFDNADQIEPRALQPYLPRTGQGHVLMTSRNPNWRSLAQVLEVDVFTQNEGLSFLLKRAGVPANDAVGVAEARELAEALGYLPLALEHAAAYIEATGSTLGSYLDLFQKQRERLWQKAAPPDAYHATIATTWEIAFQAIRQTNPAAITLLDLCCFLDGADIPLKLFQAHVETLPDELATVVSDTLALDEAIADLRRYSLLARTGDSLSIHRLVQIVTRDQMGAERAKQWVEIVVELLTNAWPYDQYNLATWAESGRLLPHLLIVIDHAITYEVATIKLAGLCSNANFYLSDRGEYQAAQPYSERALAIREQQLGPDHPDTARSLNSLGLLLYNLGDLVAAKPYLERALAITEQQLGPDHPDTARSLNSLGLLLQEQGDLTAAKPYLEHALAIAEQQLGPDHPNTATSLNNLGLLLQDLGDLVAAQPYLERALAIREQLGPDHPNTALSLNNLGVLLKAQGDLVTAKLYYERALVIAEQQLGPDHPLTATSLNNLGSLLYNQGDLTAAKPYLERALAITEQQLGPNHPNTALSLNNLGSLLQDQGDLAAARLYLERALAIWEQQLGPGHPYTARSLNNLGLLLQDQGDLAAARLYLEHALAIREQQLGPDHPDTALSLNNLAYLLQDLGDLAAAKPYLERALAITEQQLGPDHPNTRIVRNNLAGLNNKLF